MWVARDHLPDRWKPWAPDWSGQTVVVCACGPSLTQNAVEAAEACFPLIVINQAYRLAKSPGIHYACDDRWWRAYRPQSRGTRVMGSGSYPGVFKIPLEGNTPLFDGDRLGSSVQGGFQALNLAARLGAARILLLGYDAHSPGRHFWGGGHKALHGTNPDPACRLSDPTGYGAYIEHMAIAAPLYDRHGVEVINCTPGSALQGYPMRDIKEFV